VGAKVPGEKVIERKRGISMRVLLSVVAAALLVAGCGGGDSSSAGNTSNGEESGGSTVSAETIDLSLELDWIPSTNHAVLFWAQDRGFFDKNGLSVDITPPSDASAPLKLAATEKVDLAISYEPDVIQSAEQGLGVTAVGTVYPRPLANFTALADSDVKSVADVEGKAVGYSGIPTFKAYAKTELESAGLSESDVELTNVGFNLVSALLSGNVAAITEAYSTVEVITLWDETGEKPTTIPVTELGVPTYDELLFIANTNRLQADEGYADAVQRFLKAYYEAFEEMKTMPEEAAELVEEEAKLTPEYAERSIPVAIKEMEPAPGDQPGCLALGDWKKYGDWMLEEGLVKEVPDLKSLVSNEYLPHDCGE
jgi:putative hydroxymethylpyrimidine transport system substrate-binding protein